MKKIAFSLVMVFMLFGLFACNNGNKYNLTIKENAEYLAEELPNKVEEGTKINIKTKVLSDKEIEVYINEQLIEKTNLENVDYWLYEFVMPGEDVEIKLVLTNPSYYELNGEYACGVIANKNVLIARSIDMKIEDGAVYIYNRKLQGNLVKKNEVRNFSIDNLKYCTEYAEELIARFTEIDEYYMIEGCENTEDKIYNYYFFEFEEYLYTIHTVDVTSDDGNILEVVIYRMAKI